MEGNTKTPMGKRCSTAVSSRPLALPDLCPHQGPGRESTHVGFPDLVPMFGGPER